MPDFDAVRIERYKVSDKYKDALKWLNARHARDRAALRRLGIGANIRTNKKGKKRRSAAGSRSPVEPGHERGADGEDTLSST